MRKTFFLPKSPPVFTRVLPQQNRQATQANNIIIFFSFVGRRASCCKRVTRDTDVYAKIMPLLFVSAGSEKVSKLVKSPKALAQY